MALELFYLGEHHVAMKPVRTSRSERFLQVVQGYQRALLVTHDNPDPDGIAAGWALAWLIDQKLGKPARLIGGGAIVRAENRHMLKLLHPPIELVRSVECDRDTAVILVDCGLGSYNHLIAGNGCQPTAVIDHHETTRQRQRPPFRDVRPRVAAAVSIAASYLREQRLVPSPKLATAILYAIRTETRGSESYYSRLDRSVLRWATERADPSQLAEIEDAPLALDYFGDLVLALQSTLLYGDTALCLLPRAQGAEVSGEVADLLIRCERIRRVLCGAVVDKDMVLSVRTVREGENAAELVRVTLEGIGQGGGHRHRAGGKIPGAGRRETLADVFRDELRNRWLSACGADPDTRVHLIAPREIVENLYAKRNLE